MFPTIVLIEETRTFDAAATAGGEGPGSIIGRYKLLERIGEGGFGVVFMAEQQHPVRRKVALKVIKPGFDTRQVIARFEAERQALALMDHENIAKVLDAGATDSGRPYFVMELVHGVPITEYCDENQLPPRERLELFVAGLPRRAARAHQGHHPPRHQADQRAGDAARRRAGAEGDRLRRRQGDGPAADRQDAVHPLRADGRHAAVHEPRAGGDERPRRRHAQRRLQPGRAAVRAADRHDAVRQGAAEAGGVRRGAADHPRGGAAAAEHAAEHAWASRRASISAQRKSDPKQLGRLVRGELDWIVMKALEKDRARRYETANGLARDVERYLRDEPVEACPPSAVYRLKKFVRRNKGPVLAAAVVLLTLVGGIVGTTFGLVRAEQARRAQAERAEGERRAKEEAQTRLAQIEKGTEILASVFRDLDPMAAENAGVTLARPAGRRLGEAAQQLEGEAVGDPLVVARLQHVLGISLRELGHRGASRGGTRQSLPDTGAVAGGRPSRYGRHQARFGHGCTGTRRVRPGRAAVKEVLAVRTAKLGADHLDTLPPSTTWAWLYHSQEKVRPGRDAVKEVLAIRTAKLGADHLDTLATKHLLAVLYRYQGKSTWPSRCSRKWWRSAPPSWGRPSRHPLSKYTWRCTVPGEIRTGRGDAQEVVAGRTAKLGADIATPFQHAGRVYCDQGVRAGRATVQGGAGGLHRQVGARPPRHPLPPVRPGHAVPLHEEARSGDSLVGGDTQTDQSQLAPRDAGDAGRPRRLLLRRRAIRRRHSAARRSPPEGRTGPGLGRQCLADGLRRGREDDARQSPWRRSKYGQCASSFPPTARNSPPRWPLGQALMEAQKYADAEPLLLTVTRG